jgi:1-deoxy-D-xylulose-5-phosphate reductoisomerase
LGKKIKLLSGKDAAVAIAGDKGIDLVVLAISGSAALAPLLKAIETGKDVALANKEALVMAGDIIMRKARARNTKIFPIDSEQSAIWQCLDGKEKGSLKKVYLTASGGPLKDFTQSELKKVSLGRVLRHPRWKMGRKVTVDSATLMNKGLELIEAMHLFGLSVKEIEIVIHPEAIIHSMVEFIDGSILAQLSVTDMRVPIQYALTYPRRFPGSASGIDFFKLGKLTFHKPSMARFPCFRLAWEAASRGGSAPCVLNASNEIAVAAFLNKRIDLLTIPLIIEKVLARHKIVPRPGLDDILRIDAWARQQAHDLACGLAGR